MFCDFHTHTEFSPDSSATVFHQIEQAVRLGMKEICITDHDDHDGTEGDHSMELNYEAYIPCLQKMQQLFEGKIHIRIGVELGLGLHIADYLQDVSQKYPFDFIIGSNHFIDGMDPYYPEYYEGKSEREAYERFFEKTLERIKGLDCFDVLGHLDYIVRYGPSKNKFYSFDAYREYIDPILKLLVEKGKGLECNTGGYSYRLGHPNPCEDILIRYRELGGEILTIGSDAHQPEYIGCHFDQLQSVLTGCGFRYYTVFHQRKPDFLPI